MRAIRIDGPPFPCPGCGEDLAPPETVRAARSRVWRALNGRRRPDGSTDPSPLKDLRYTEGADRPPIWVPVPHGKGGCALVFDWSGHLSHVEAVLVP